MISLEGLDSKMGSQYDLYSGVLQTNIYLTSLKTQLFNFLGNMGYMFVKD